MVQIYTIKAPLSLLVFAAEIASFAVSAVPASRVGAANRHYVKQGEFNHKT
jgi:hypothetical protein